MHTATGSCVERVHLTGTLGWAKRGSVSQTGLFDTPAPGPHREILQQLGCAVLVDSVGIRGAGAALSRHCSPRSWQRYKRELKALPVRGAGSFRALEQVDQALTRFEPLCMKTFQAAATKGNVADRAL